MKVISFIPDRRIEATNVLIELTIAEYLTFAKDILNNNEYQRKKVIKSTIQELLKADLLKGCTIPPIVLAIKKTNMVEEFNYLEFADTELVAKAFNARDLLILDGLQRTFVMLDLDNDIKTGKLQPADPNIFYDQVIRAELYIGLKKLNILYRMLTLNTGQTTMSTRHLMEILYLDYYNTPIEGIVLLTDKDNERPDENTSEFRFKEILDGYYSYIEGTEVPIDRADILDNIQTIKDLERTDEEKDGFKKFLLTYQLLLDRIIELSEGFIYQEEDFQSTEFQLSGPPFGKTALGFFKKSQALTGLGSAFNFLKNKRNINFSTIDENIPQLATSRYSGTDLFKLLNKHFDYIRSRSKKVGNDQRYYFKVLFQSLFDNEAETYLLFDASLLQAYKRVKEKIED